MKYHLYTNSYSERPYAVGAGSYAYLLTDDYGNTILSSSGIVEWATDNQIKMTAIIEGINDVRNEYDEIEIISSSKYALGVLSGRWHAVKNLGLIDQFNQVSKDISLSFKWLNRGNIMSHLHKVCCRALKKYQAPKWRHSRA